MAEGVASDVAGKILACLSPSALRELCLPRNVKAELSKLEAAVSVVKDVLLDVEERHNNDNNQEVTSWFRRLKKAIYEVDDLLDDFSTQFLRRKTLKGNEMSKEVRIFFSKSNQIAMGHRVKALREKLDAIAADRFKFLLESQIERWEREKPHSFVHPVEIIGRDDDKSAMIKLLLETHDPEEIIRVVPIVGDDGLGKTTLAQMVFNDEKFKAHFELKLWVCLSDRFEVKIVVEKILEAATQNKVQPNCDMETLENHLRDVIRGKKYFLVLDDVWIEDPGKWSMVIDVLMKGVKGSRIVVTTRSSELFEQITGTIFPYFLKGLSNSQSLSLFEKIAFEKQIQTSNYPNPELKSIGEKIIERCHGSPLAIKAIGRVLFSKKTKSEWSQVLENITQLGTGIKPVLRLSYYHLPSHLKQCFAYCSLFPKNYEINKHALINLWMAQGFLQSSDKGRPLEDVGHDYFMDLLWRSFFDEVKEDDLGNIKSFKMHDLMHELAKSVAGPEYSLTNAHVESIEKNIHVSLLFEELDSSWKIRSALLKANKIRAFLFPDRYLSESSGITSIRSFKSLRMLDLKKSKFEKLPHSMCRLKHLRYLDVSENPKIRELPNSFTRLENLQTLDLNKCIELVKLPREMKNMVSLRHLKNRGCENLKYMPAGVGQLTSLRTLQLFVVGSRGRQIGKLRELGGLNNLRGQLKIMGLGNAAPDEADVYLKEKSSLESLTLDWDGTEAGPENDEMVLESLQPHPNIKKLEVSWYMGFKLSNWLSSLTNLVKIDIIECNNCQNLPPIDRLPSLRFLTLMRLGALEHVSEAETETDMSTATTFYPSLEYLKILNCPNLKGWWRRRMKEDDQEEDDDEEASTAELLPCFPRLSTLRVDSCPKLRSLPLFPTLNNELVLASTSGRPLLQTIQMRTDEKNTTSAAATALPLSNLKSLFLDGVENVESALEEFLQNRHCIGLESLSIVYCPELTRLPKEVHALNSLRNLAISCCPNLKGLPHWISNLTSLRRLKIYDCPELKALPDGMSRLTNLNGVWIHGCPHLRESCKRDTGADWTKISYVQDIDIK